MPWWTRATITLVCDADKGEHGEGLVGEFSSVVTSADECLHWARKAGWFVDGDKALCPRHAPREGQ